MSALQKIDILKSSLSDASEFDKILDKLFDVVLSNYRNRMARYERDLHEFEEEYELESSKFYQRFESGEMGDKMDFFEWAGLYEIYQAIQRKVKKLETSI